MKTSTSKRFRRGASIALTSMLLAAPAAQARLDEGAAQTRSPEQPPARIVDDGGFSWTAAGIGAGAALAAIAAAGGAGQALRRRSLPAHS